jgi:hypothetical protein
MPISPGVQQRRVGARATDRSPFVVVGVLVASPVLELHRLTTVILSLRV